MLNDTEERSLFLNLLIFRNDYSCVLIYFGWKYFLSIHVKHCYFNPGSRYSRILRFCPNRIYEIFQLLLIHFNVRSIWFLEFYKCLLYSRKMNIFFLVFNLKVNRKIFKYKIITFVYLLDTAVRMFVAKDIIIPYISSLIFLNIYSDHICRNKTTLYTFFFIHISVVNNI